VKRILVWGALAVAAWGQSRPHRAKADEIDVFRPLLQFDVVVTDPQGHLVTGLTPADFEIRYNGKPQTLETFAYVNPHPAANAAGGSYIGSGTFARPPIELKPDQIRRTVVIVVDDLGLSEAGASTVRAAIVQFIAQMQEGDAAAIFRTSADAASCPDTVTSDKRVLLAAAACVTYDYSRPRNQAAAASGQQAALRTVLAGVESIPGRKAVALVSAETGAANLRRLLSDANQVSAVFYPIPVEGNPAGDSGGAWLARMTGGLPSEEGADVSAQLTRVLRDQDGYYLLGYKEEAESLFSAGSPEISVVLKRPGLQLRYRSMPLRSTGAEPASTDDWAGWEARGSGGANQAAIPIRMTALFAQSATQGSGVDVLLHIDAKDLTFTRDLKGMYHGSIALAVAAASDTVFPRMTVRTLNETWNEADYRKALAQGLDQMMEFRLPLPGGFQVMATVTDETSGATGIAREFLEVPDLKAGLALSGIVLRKGDERSLQNGEAPLTSTEPGANPVDRQFGPGDSIIYAYRVFSLTSGQQNTAQAETQVRVLHNGRTIYTAEKSTIHFKSAADPTHRAVAGVLHIGGEAGTYVLEVTVKDLLAPKPSTATAYIDYQVK